MDYKEAHDYFEKLGFSFRYEEASPSWAWSDCHVYWNGVEFGVMYYDHMSLRDGEGIMDFHYDYIETPTQELLNTLDRFWSSVDLVYRTQKEKTARVEAVRSYFDSRRSS